MTKGRDYPYVKRKGNFTVKNIFLICLTFPKKSYQDNR